MRTEITMTDMRTILIEEMAVNNTVLMLGEPGVGKSAIVCSLKDEPNVEEVIVINANTLAGKEDIQAPRTVEKNGKYTQIFFPMWEITHAVEVAEAHPDKTVILFIDEITRTTPETTTAILTLETSRRIGDTKLPDNIQIILAGNDKGNVNALDDASISRFGIYSVKPDADTFLQVVPNINPYVKNVLTKHPHLIFTKQNMDLISADDDNTSNDDNDDFNENTSYTSLFDDEFTMTSFTTPRTIEKVSKLLNAAGDKKLLNWLNTAVSDDKTMLDIRLEAHVGNTPFTVELRNEIVNNLLTNPSIAVTMKEPTIWPTLKSAATIDDLRTILTGLTPKMQMEVLSYALCDDNNNENILKILSTLITSETIDSNDVQQFFTVAKNANERNLDVLRNIKSSDSYISLLITTAKL